MRRFSLRLLTTFGVLTACHSGAPSAPVDVPPVSAAESQSPLPMERAPLSALVRVAQLCEPSALTTWVATHSGLTEQDALPIAAAIEAAAPKQCTVALLPNLRHVVAVIPDARLKAGSDTQSGRMAIIADGEDVVFGPRVAIEQLRASGLHRWLHDQSLDARFPNAYVAGMGWFVPDARLLDATSGPPLRSIGFVVEADQLRIQLHGKHETLVDVQRTVRESVEHFAEASALEKVALLAALDGGTVAQAAKELLEAIADGNMTSDLDAQTLTFAIRLDPDEQRRLAAATGFVTALFVPTVLKIRRREWTSEPRIRIADMYDGIVDAMYADPEQPSTFTGCPFPGEGSIGFTPPLTLACAQGPGGQCTPDIEGAAAYPATLWDEDKWEALGFSQREPHRFHYNVRWRDFGGTQGCQFTAQAFGDLDQDGVFSTFERAAAADKAGINSLGLYIDREVE